MGFAPVVTKNGGEGNALAQWGDYSTQHQGWIEEYRSADGSRFPPPEPISETIIEGTTTATTDASFLLPLWQTVPVTATTAGIVNTNLLTNTASGVSRMMVKSVTDTVDVLTSIDTNDFLFAGQYPRSSLMISPASNEKEGGESVGGIIWALLSWDFLFSSRLPPDAGRLLVEVQNDCGVELSFAVVDGASGYIGEGLRHDSEFNDLAFRMFPFGDTEASSSECPFSVTAYPTFTFKNDYVTNAPWVYMTGVLCVFFVAAIAFVIYDYNVQRKQAKLFHSAQKTSAIVAEIFPKNVQKRIIEEKQERERNNLNASRSNLAPKSELKSMMSKGDEKSGVENYKGKPIADLFPETTIMFADIVGFTAWSSTREPSAVFTLLEGIYAAFDRIAARRRVFKVETVGDCYVAVVGLPDPRKDHAIVMGALPHFGRDYPGKVRSRLFVQIQEPDARDGSGTWSRYELSQTDFVSSIAELGLRVGLHSGPTVAGVLRGQRSRFQLFGDSVNTTARMESTGHCNRIHVSQDTADLLQASGKSHWLQMRKERVCAKGKGELQTYWLATGGEEDLSLGAGMGNEVTENQDVTSVYDENPEITEARLGENPVHLSEKQMRLVEWNTEILCRKLEDIATRREAFGTIPDKPLRMEEVERSQLENGFGMALDEVVEIIELPTYRASSSTADPPPKPLSTKVSEQLLDYVQTIASMYHANPFHNFEHASHVCMSTQKLLSRIVAPDLEIDRRRDVKSILHDHTYGITSDPLTQFAVTLSALIHDVDHSGVPNVQLVKEHTSLAAAYNNKSVAEQNSVDLAWDLLMEDCYKDLRRTIYCNEVEFKRFRQLVVNTVLATDIMDKDLGGLRKERWNKAFAEQPLGQESSKDNVNRKATIVIEHLIQASDVAHTMQHWHVYRKWNARLFREMYRAYVDGRADKDPCENWYKGELGFFDFYVIPLAKKLKNCGVFGVSSDEYLKYAENNRREWEQKGQEVVAELVASVRHMTLGSHNGDGEESFIPSELISQETVPRRMSQSHESLDYVNSQHSRTNK
eukprot:scaffold1498_cov163-Amphora_coffeaeformis.AAC.10